MTWLPAKDKVVRAVRVERCVLGLALVPAFPCNPCCRLAVVGVLLMAVLFLLWARRPFGILVVEAVKVDVSERSVLVVLYDVGADAATILSMINAVIKRRKRCVHHCKV